MHQVSGLRGGHVRVSIHGATSAFVLVLLLSIGSQSALAGPPTGACCLPDGSCAVETQADCTTAGGTWDGNADCDTTGACTISGDCITTTEDCCDGIGGEFDSNATCDDTGCAISPAPLAAGVREDVPDWATHVNRILTTPPNPARGAPQVFIDGSDVLQIIGTASVDRIKLWIQPSDSSRLEVQIPDDGSGLVVNFALADFNSVHIDTGADDDLVVFDDLNGNVAAAAEPFDIETNAGGDIIITRTGALTLAQVLTLITTLDSARNLATQADAIAQLAGAVTNTGGGSNDLISAASALAQAAANGLVLPTESYMTDLTNQLIIPTANAVPGARTAIIDPALQQINDAYANLTTVAQTLANNAQTDLIDKADELAQAADGDLVPLANSLEGCGVNSLLSAEGNAFITQMESLIAQIQILADLCPEKGPEPPEQPNDCPELEELVDCAETAMDDFMAMADICAEVGDDLADDADELLGRAETELEQPGDAYEITFDNFEATAETFSNAAELYADGAETWLINLETQLQTISDTFEQRAQTEYVTTGAALETQAQTELQNRADQLATQAAQLSTDAQAVVTAAAALLNGPGRGPGVGDCAQISTTNTITGGPGPNFLLGTSGGDHIKGLGGPDLIVGGPGDDKLEGGDGTDLIFGGSGTNELNGGDNLDILIGGGDNDCLYGEDGFDLIVGFAGDDQADGGEYIDVILMGDGTDQAWGRDGIDVMFGGDGDDDMDGGNCIDALFGLAGDDTLTGGDGQVLTIGSFSIDLGDVIFGGAGADTIFGDAQSGDGTGIDVVFGGDDNDTMKLADGGDMVIGATLTLKLGNVAFGGNGDDTIESKKGIDVLFGQNDNDTISSDEGDVLSFSNGNFELALGDLIFGGPGNDEIDSDTQDGTEDIDFVFAGDGDDTVRGYDGGMLTVNSFEFMLGNLVFGGNGDDDITTEAGLDVIFCGADDDTVSAGDGATLEIGANFDIKLGDLIFARGGDDVIHADVPDVADGVGDDGVDLIFGGDGIDQLYGAGGGTVTINSVSFLFGNLMFGGNGDDTIVGDYQTFDAGNREKGIDLIFGGPDNDTIDAAPGDLLVVGNFAVNIGNLVFGGPGDDNITTVAGVDIVFCGRGEDTANTGDGIDFVFGSQDDDTLTVSDGGVIVIPAGGPVPVPLGNFVFGGDGNDLIDSDGRILLEIDLLFGNKCDDTIFAGQGLLDLVFGNTENDTIWGEAGADLLFGGRDDDEIHGGDGAADLIFGGKESDTIFGDDGIDLIFGGQQRDTIDAGSGALDLVFGGEAPDIVRGGDGIDVLFGNRGGDDMYGDNGLDLIFGNRGKDCIHGGSDLDIIFGGDENDLIHGDSGLTLAFGNSGNDQLYGGIDVDLLFGNADNDRLDGGGNADILFGNAGADVLFGGNGPNVLFGNAGNDLLFGGPLLDLAFGNAGSDLIFGNSAVDLLFGNSENDTIYGDSAGDLMFGNAGNDDLAGGSERDFIFGNSGSDRILLSSGNDFAFGNNDNDDLRAGNSDGNNDYLFGNRGNDSLDRCETNDKRIGGGGSDNKTANCSGFSFAGVPGCGEVRGTVRVNPGAVPRAGITVYLDNNNNGVLDGEPSMATLADDPDTHEDETGTYVFMGLSGTQRVRQQLPATLTQISPAGAQVVTLGSCELATGLDFLDRDACLPEDPSPCVDCPCPPGFESRPVTTSTLRCPNGDLCTSDVDCDCGGACAPVSVTTCECKPVDACSPNGIFENEDACGPTLMNAGCDAPQGFPQLAPKLTCGQSVCGTIQSGDAANPPDTDWWSFVSPVCNLLTICMDADFRGRIEVYNFGCGGPLLMIIPFAPGVPVCQTIPPGGQFYFRVVATAPPPVPCSDYVMTINCEPCIPSSDKAESQSLTPEEPPAQTEPSDPESAKRGIDAPLPLPPAIPPAPHDARKNRYLSMLTGNGERVVAFQITIPPCRRAWIGEPVLLDFNGRDEAWVSEIVANPVYRVWSEDVVHIRGCAIAPQNTYELRAVNLDNVESDPLLRSTVDVWGDVAGPPIGGMFSPPDGVANQLDLSAVQASAANSPLAPHTTWTDLAPLTPDYFVGAGDLTLVQDAINGQTYPPSQFGIEDIVECELATVCSAPCGDSNCDGRVSVSDIGHFVRAVTQGGVVWASVFPDGPSCDFLCTNDTNHDSFVTVGDIAAFVQAVVTGDCD